MYKTNALHISCIRRMRCNSYQFVHTNTLYVIIREYTVHRPQKQPRCNNNFNFRNETRLGHRIRLGFVNTRTPDSILSILRLPKAARQVSTNRRDADNQIPPRESNATDRSSAGAHVSTNRGTFQSLARLGFA